MKAPIFAAMIAAFGMAALAQPAAACSNGYEPVWIQGSKVCKIKTPKMGLKANTGVKPGVAKKQATKMQPARQ